MEKQVKAKIEEIRKALQADGGDIELVDITDKTVRVTLHGACGGCPHAAMTLKNYVEQTLRDEIDPEIIVERA